MTVNNLTFSAVSKNGFKRLASKDIATYEAGGFMLVDEESSCADYDRIFLSSLSLSDKIIDAVTERVLTKSTKLIVRTGSDLNEVGRFESKYRLTPIQLLHTLGLLDGAAILGGAYLDRDDVDLMTQSDAKLILTPSYDMGKGLGIADTAMCLKRGLKIGLSSFNNQFNLSGSIEFEAVLVKLCASALLHDENALSEAQIKAMIKYDVFE